jgi:hypothetical protein
LRNPSADRKGGEVSRKQEHFPSAVSDEEWLGQFFCQAATFHHEQIARFAYEIFLNRGGTHGKDVDDWLQAQTEVLERRREEYGCKQ